MNKSYASPLADPVTWLLMMSVAIALSAAKTLLPDAAFVPAMFAILGLTVVGLIVWIVRTPRQ